MTIKICKVKDCEEPVRYAGLCGMHYKRQWRHGDVNYCDDRTKLQNLAACLAPDCEERGANKGYCNVHYNRMYKYNRLHTVIAPKGTGTINNDGYRVISGKYEHIILAEKALGKPLPKGAIVHHMNEKPWDNHTPFNLVVCPSQDYHLLLHRRMKELGYAHN